MAAQVFQNQTNEDLIIPTVDGSMSLYPMEYVGGSYYLHIPQLTDVTSSNIDSDLVKYFYPESGEAGSSLSGFDTATGTLPIQVDVEGTAFTVSIQPISGLDISDGQVVRALNTLTDTVTVTGQAGISVDVNVGDNSIDITNTQLGLTDVYATAPLYLTLGEGNVSLEGSIAITPTDNGGAVALQTGEAEYQNGFAAIRQLFLKSADVEPFFRAYSSTDTLLGSLDEDGIAYLDNTVTQGLETPTLSVFETIAYDGDEYSYGAKLAELNEIGTSFFDLPILVKNVLSLGKSETSLGVTGTITGVQDNTFTVPFIELSAEATQTVPLIRLNSGNVTGDPNSNVYLSVADSDGTPLISLHGDGVVTAKTIEADVVDATTVFADNLYTSTLFVVGPDTVNITTSGGPHTIIADCSAGEVVVQLPDLTSFARSLQLCVQKVDTTHTALSVVNGPNSTINGSTSALNITTQYTGKTITSSGVNWYITSSIG